MRRASRIVLRTCLTSSLLGSAFLCGFNVSLIRDLHRNVPTARRQVQAVRSVARHVFAPLTAQAADDPTLIPTDAYRRTLSAIHSSYLPGPLPVPNTTQLTYSGIDGMLDTIGDRYTEFWTPDEYKENMEETSGSFVGIGAELELTRDHHIAIADPIENSPAADAGLQAGDVILAINSVSVSGSDVDKVGNAIRGAEGTFVRLTVSRNSRQFQFNLRRSVVHRPVVEWRMEDGANKIGYIRLQMFNEQADTQFDAALAKLEKQGMKGLVFDLRDNPGGLLQVAQDLASRFLQDGAVAWIKEKNGRLSSLNVERDKHRSPLYKGAYPVAVLVNGNSASAAEIVSGAIQDSGAGVLVGTRTYGKGLVQTIMPLSDDSAVKITTQHYFTRNKHDINMRRDEEEHPITGSGGILPNVVIDTTPKEETARQAALTRSPHDRIGADRLDPQVRKALETVTTALQSSVSAAP